jgi:hypothetical protein
MHSCLQGKTKGFLAGERLRERAQFRRRLSTSMQTFGAILLLKTPPVCAVEPRGCAWTRQPRFKFRRPGSPGGPGSSSAARPTRTRTRPAPPGPNPGPLLGAPCSRATCSPWRACSSSWSCPRRPPPSLSPSQERVAQRPLALLALMHACRTRGPSCSATTGPFQQHPRPPCQWHPRALHLLHLRRRRHGSSKVTVLVPVEPVAWRARG